MEKWPSLECIDISIVDPDHTTEEEAIAFLSAVSRCCNLQETKIYNTGYGQPTPHFLCLQDRDSDPSSVKLNANEWLW